MDILGFSKKGRLQNTVEQVQDYFASKCTFLLKHKNLRKLIFGRKLVTAGNVMESGTVTLLLLKEGLSLGHTEF